MKKTILFTFLLSFTINLSLKAWWDPGHLVTAMIAYENLTPEAKKQVDALTKQLQRDYPYVNHFITTGPWPDDLKAEGVRTFDTWHYTNIPLNTNRLALADAPVIDIIWAINQMDKVLGTKTAKPVDKARHLAFLVHLVGDIHQPLHSTSVHDNERPGGNIGGNAFRLKGEWRNLHALWDDGCGYLTELNDINPYGKDKKALSKKEIKRIKKFSKKLMEDFPKSHFENGPYNTRQLDPDFWALESHKYAVEYGYRGTNEVKDDGYKKWIRPNSEPSELYLKNGQEVVKERLALAGYRLAEMLNATFGKKE